MLVISSLAILTSFLVIGTNARDRCVVVTGKLECKKNPDAAHNVAIQIFDKDTTSIPLIDDDDLMGFGITEADGSFKVGGCANDIDWLWVFGKENNPEPFLRIYHYCNHLDAGETLDLPVFNDFVPLEKNYGIIELDSE